MSDLDHYCHFCGDEGETVHECDATVSCRDCCENLWAEYVDHMNEFPTEHESHGAWLKLAQPDRILKLDFEDDDWDTIEAAAKRMGVTPNEFIVKALTEYVDNK